MLTTAYFRFNFLFRSHSRLFESEITDINKTMFQIDEKTRFSIKNDEFASFEKKGKLKLHSIQIRIDLKE